MIIHSAPGSRCGHRPSWWRRAAVAVSIVAVAAGASACGGSAPSSAVWSTTSANHASPPQLDAAGRQVFTTAGCASCHTLAAVRATGTVGPDLDQLKPSVAAVVAQVTHGGGGMPSFAGRLSRAQIDAVARFVASATHRDG